MLKAEVIEEVTILWQLFLSILFAGVFFLFVVIIAILVNQVLLFLGIVFSNSILVVSNGLVLKSYIMLLDYVVVGTFVTITTILAILKISFFGYKHFKHMLKDVKKGE